jgi:hypothetical protein
MSVYCWKKNSETQIGYSTSQAMSKLKKKILIIRDLFVAGCTILFIYLIFIF